MKRQTLTGLALGLALAAPAVAAEPPAPSAVTFADGAVEASLTGVPGDVAEGEKVMTTRPLGNCVACHVISALPKAQFQGNVAPTLDGAASRWTEAQLRGIVANAKMTFPDTVMPAYYKNEGYIRPGDGYTAEPAPENLPPILTAQQVEDVVAFLMTLK